MCRVKKGDRVVRLLARSTEMSFSFKRLADVRFVFNVEHMERAKWKIFEDRERSMDKLKTSRSIHFIYGQGHIISHIFLTFLNLWIFFIFF
jgi:hypothetical protein